jgi:uncharacterized protein (TIGR02147 family)
MEQTSERIQPNIFEYDNYRRFLNDTYVYLKSVKRAFSFRYFSKAAGLRSPNFLKLVIEGKRNLSDDSIGRFAQALKLSKGETEFFETLVRFNQTSNSDVRAQFAERILKSKSYRKIHPLGFSLFNYYSRWYFVAIREMVAWHTFVEDPGWIASKLAPAVSLSEVAQALTELEALGLLSRDGKGRLYQSDPILNTDNEVASVSIATFHKEMIRLASESIDRVEREEREISSVTIPISRTSAVKIKKLVQEFRKELLAISDSDANCDQVYQLNFQFFPLAKSDVKKGGSC